MKKLILIPILFISVLAFSSVTVVAGILKGTVSDSKTGELLPFANVVVELKDELVTGVMSSFDGEFVIKPLKPGVYTVQVSFLGYSTERILNVEILDGVTKTMDFKMGNQSNLNVRRSSLSNTVTTFCCCSWTCYVPNIPDSATDLFAEQDSLNDSIDMIMPSFGFSSSIQESGFMAFPNPTDNLMSLTHLPETDEMLFMDINGKVIQTISVIDQTDLTIDLGSLPSGMYLLRFMENGQQ